MKIEDFSISEKGYGNGCFVFHSGRFVSYPYQRNDCFLAAYAAHGVGTLKIDEKVIFVNEGDIFIIRPDTIYKFIPNQGIRRIDMYYCYFTYETLGNNIKDFHEHFHDSMNLFDGTVSYIKAVDSDNLEIRDIFIRLIDEQLDSLPCANNIIQCAVPILITKILRNIKTRDFKRVYSSNRVVDDAIHYIHDKLYNNISLNGVADHLRLSPSYVCRLFKKHTGMTTTQFINCLRIEKIKDILKNTGKHADAVPDMFGCSVEYLRYLFKRETGMTMQEYQDRYNYRKNPLDK